jgi:hypothetical protein
MIASKITHGIWLAIAMIFALSFVPPDVISAPADDSATQAVKQQIMSETDSDGDGVSDRVDNCPNEHNPATPDCLECKNAIRNLKKCSDAYFKRNSTYPASERPLYSSAYGCQPVEGVDISYIGDESGYIIEAKRNWGGWIYALKGPGGNIEIFWLDKNGVKHSSGQSDYDLDGFGDVCDVCPKEAEDDVDADGICAKKDNCPEVFNPGSPQPDMDGDGLGNACDPDADADGFGYVNFSDTCCSDYWAVYDGKTGAFLRVHNEGDSLGAGEIRGGDCDDGDPAVLPDKDPCPAQATVSKPEGKPGGNPNTKDEDKDGKPDKQETNTLVKLTDTFKTNADTDGDNISDGSEDPDDTGGPIVAGPDNCPRTPNADQTNMDGDAAEPVDAFVGMATKGGDACDTDADNDGIADKSLVFIDASGQLVFQDIPNTPNGDNCPLTFNPDQMNSDGDQLGDACDPDIDNDGFCKESLCPDKDKVYTFDPKTGVISPSPVTYAAQTLDANEVRGGDCNDTNSNVNPGQTEQVGDAVDNDCDPGTPDSAHAIQVQITVTGGDGTLFNCNSSGGHPCANWLPIDGDTITLTASVSGAPATVAVNFSVEEVTRLPGKYLNDASEKHLLPQNPNDPCTACAQDFVITGTGNQRVLACQDYGAYIRIRMTAEYPAGSPLVPVIISFPKDDNTNKIADDWEEKLAQELLAAQSVDPSINGLTQNGDKDYIVVDKNTGELNSIRGDGITDQFEYRGAKWGPGVIDANNGFQKLVKTTSGPGELYQTPAYLPMGTVSHFRMNPFRPDVFVKFYNYSAIADGRANPSSLTYDPPNPLTLVDLDFTVSCGVDCPFAMGTALVDEPNGAGVDVHIVRAKAAVGQPEAVGEENIDVLVMTNDTTTTYGSETGHILRFGKRSWLTGTLGNCPVGNGTGYGPVIDTDPCRTFTIAIGYWFADVPYRDGGRDYTISGADKNHLLDAVNNRNRVEDKDDDGIRDGGENSIVNDAWLDGDCYLRNEIATGNYLAGELSTYDIDQDGLIEMPTLFGPDDLATSKEYSKPQVFKVITTHEAIHGLGAGHTQESTCLMFANVNELDKDGNLSSDAKRDLDIFNGRQAP